MLLLDEPTTGLDAFNAHAVVQSLSTLAERTQKTILFTIHQVQKHPGGPQAAAQAS